MENKINVYQKTPYFDNFNINFKEKQNIEQARALVMLGDSITTDHISPAGKIPKDYPAGKYLISNEVEEKDFNTYGSRRGNHEVMVRGAFWQCKIEKSARITKRRFLYAKI